MSQACTPMLVGVAFFVSEILVPSKTAKFPFLTMDYYYIVVFEGSTISKTGEALPTKIVVRACDINLYLHEFFEPILIY